MAIQYVCDTCQDCVQSYYSRERNQWEPPQGWVNVERIVRDEDDDRSEVKHFCSAACVTAYLDAEVEA